MLYEVITFVSETLKIGPAYTETAIRTPVDVSERLFCTLAKNLDPTQLVELTAATAFGGFNARFPPPQHHSR